jgi:hypothetical protein
VFTGPITGEHLVSLHIENRTQMAESIAIHFANVNEAELLAFLDEIAKRSPLGNDTTRWVYPPKRHRIIVYFYSDILAEYDEGQTKALINALGAYPTTTVCIELMRTQSNNSCGAASEITQKLLQRFTGVVDDLCSNIWKPDQIVRFGLKREIRFLDCYRSPVHTWAVHRQIAPLLISLFGGVDTIAQVIGYAWKSDNASLLYSYKQDGLESSRTFLGTVPTGWDLHDMQLMSFQKGEPKWMERYTKGYSFTVRHLDGFPEFHCYFEHFTFDP